MYVALTRAQPRQPFAQPEHLVPPQRYQALSLRKPGGGRRAFVPIWRRPWMTMNADTYGSSVLAAVGIVNVYAGASERYPTTTLLDAHDLAPDLVVAPSEPYPFGARHVRELEAVAADVRLVDGRDLFWWGTRSAGAVERLREVLG
jgi:hypothetical protein